MKKVNPLKQKNYEIKEKKRIKNGTGNATFRTDLIDAVFNLTEEELTKGARHEIF